MSNPAVMIATGVVVAAAAIAAIIAFFVEKEPERPMSHGRRHRGKGSQSPRTLTPPPSPPSSRSAGQSRRRIQSSDTCANCQKCLLVKILPCNHASLCARCDRDYLRNNNTCPTCCGRIDGCSPPLPNFGKCRSCRKFTELFEFLPCKHSLSICIGCFERQNKSYKKCPTCEQIIRGHTPKSSTTLGLCAVCQEFTWFAKFRPCGHGNFCSNHAEKYLESNYHRCSECGVKAFV